MKKESKISFLRCRHCLVYVWFGFILFFQILSLILIFLATAVVGSVDAGSPDTDESDAELRKFYATVGLAVAIVLIQMFQGITYVQYVKKSAEKYWDRIHEHYTRHH